MARLSLNDNYMHGHEIISFIIINLTTKNSTCVDQKVFYEMYNAKLNCSG